MGRTRGEKKKNQHKFSSPNLHPPRDVGQLRGRVFPHLVSSSVPTAGGVRACVHSALPDPYLSLLWLPTLAQDVL